MEMQKQQKTEPEAIILPQEPNVPNQPPAHRSYGHTQTTPGYPQQQLGAIQCSRQKNTDKFLVIQ